MARDFNGTSHYLESSTMPVSAYPFTLACWVNPDSQAGAQFLFGFGSSTLTNHYTYLGMRGDLVGDPFGIIIIAGGSAGNAQTTTAYQNGQWQHICGVFTSATSRAIFRDGAGKGTSSVNIPFSASLDLFSVARLSRGAASSGYSNCQVAECAVWDAALSDGEVALLAKGVSPITVRPTNIKTYHPVIGKHSPEIDHFEANDLTVTGATAFAHPRVFSPPITNRGLLLSSGIIPSAAIMNQFQRSNLGADLYNGTFQ